MADREPWVLAFVTIFAVVLVVAIARIRTKRLTARYVVSKSHVTIEWVFPEPKVFRLPVSEAARIVELRMHHDGIGNIYFGAPAPIIALSLGGEDASDGIPDDPPAFERIREAERVFELIRSLR